MILDRNLIQTFAGQPLLDATQPLVTLNGGQLSGMRNRIINGSFMVSQRGTSATVTAGTAVPTASTGYFTADRFYVYSTGANVTVAQVNGVNPISKRMQITGATGVTAVGVGQRIEALNSHDMAGKPCTLSLDLASSQLTTATWTAFYANSTDTFGTVGTPTRTQIATGTFTISATVTNFQTTFNVPSAATTGIEIVITVGALTTGTFTTDNWQFEIGSVATAFEARPFGMELGLCQRYFEVLNNLSTTLSGARHNTVSTSSLWMFISFSEKRAAPTLSFSGAITNIQPGGITASTPVIAPGSAVGVKQFRLQLTTSAAMDSSTYHLNTGDFTVNLNAEF